MPGFRPISPSGNYSQNMGVISDQLRELSVPTLRIAKLMDGTKDPTFTYSPTAADLSSNNFLISFNHGLNFIPNVVGSYTNSFDNKSRQLPHIGYFDGNSYFGSMQDYTIQVDRVDSTTLTVRVVIHTLSGGTYFAVGGTLTFIFYCLTQKMR